MIFSTMWYVYMRPAKAAHAQTDLSLCLLLEYSMAVKLLIEQHFEFLSLKGVYTCQNTTLLEITCHGSYVAEKY